MPIVVQIGNGPAPLFTVVHRAVVIGHEGVIGVLVQHVHVRAHIQLDDVVQAITIHIRNAYASTGVAGVREGGARVGEGQLRGGR